MEFGKEFNGRIKIVVDEIISNSHLTKKEIADKLKITPQGLRNILHGDYNPKHETIRYLVENFNVSLNYLYFEKEPKFISRELENKALQELAKLLEGDLSKIHSDFGNVLKKIRGK